MSSPDPEAPADTSAVAATSPTVPKETVAKALLPYRALAWVTGLWLIALCYEMVMKYGFGVDNLGWIGIVHGWVYFVYLMCTMNLAVKVRWPVGKTVGVLLAGTIPFLGIIVEHFQTKRLKAQFAL